MSSSDNPYDPEVCGVPSGQHEDSGSSGDPNNPRSLSPRHAFGERIRSAPVMDQSIHQTDSQSPNILRSSSMHTPTLGPKDRFIESWMSQSLAMPSATNDVAETIGTCGNVAKECFDRSSDHGNNTNLTTNLRHHRRDGSLDSFTSFLGQQTSHSNEGSTTSSPHPYGNMRVFSASTSTQKVWGSNSVVDESFFNLDFMASSMSTTSSFSSLPSRRNAADLDESSQGNPYNSYYQQQSSAVSSEIHDAARITNWQTVAELCERIPEAASYIGGDGWTALHHACNRRCPYPKIVESLIRAYPDALLIAEEKGWLPLHYACRFKAPKEVVELLLHMHPEKGRVGVSRPDRKGRSPLYYAVRYNAPSGVASLLIDMDASAVLEEDQNADSPLALVWDDWAEKLDGKRTLQKILWDEDTSGTGNNAQGSLDFNCSAGTIAFEMNQNKNAERKFQDLTKRANEVRKRLERQTQALERWKKVNIFLKAAFGFPLNEDWEREGNTTREEEKKDMQQEEHRKWRVLHAISAIKCHYTLFLLAASLHPEQAFEMDRNDLRRIENIYNKSRDGSDMAATPSNLTALHLAASSHAGGDSGRIVLNQLLQLNPKAVKSVDTEGSTPLHRIVENKCKPDWTSDAVEDLYASNPDALRISDVNGRLPLHRAASAIHYFPKKVEDAGIRSRSKICRLLEEHNGSAASLDHFGCLPLHLLAQNGSRWDVQAQALLDANPNAVRVRTGVKFGNRLPLHLATANKDADPSMIGKLLESNPLGASQADRKGCLPLHLACEAGHSWESIRLIHEAYPLAVEQAEQNKRAWHALHMAAAAETSCAVGSGELLSELIARYPNAANLKDADDRYPLHLACMTERDWDNGLSCLFDANANAIRSPDREGRVPLHIVALRYSPKALSLSPKVVDIRKSQNRLSRTSEALERERLTAKELNDARELTNIFEVLKADPTVLIAY